MEITTQLITNGLIAGSLYALMALGFTLIYGATKFFNIAHGIYIPIGAYTLYVLVNLLGLNVLLSIVMAVAVCGMVGWLLEKAIFLPLRRKKASGLVLMVASVGVYVSVQALAGIIFTSQFKQIASVAGLRVTIAGAHLTQVQLLSIVAAAVVFLLLLLLMNKTHFGRSVRAITDNPELARISGINVERITGQLFFIGSALAGFVGVLVGLDTGLEPTMGFSLMLKGIIGTVIGGSFSLVGSLLGAVGLGQIESIGTWFIGGIWKDAIAFVVLIIFLLVRPAGVAGWRSGTGEQGGKR